MKVMKFVVYFCDVESLTGNVTHPLEGTGIMHYHKRGLYALSLGISCFRATCCSVPPGRNNPYKRYFAFVDILLLPAIPFLVNFLRSLVP